MNSKFPREGSDYCQSIFLINFFSSSGASVSVVPYSTNTLSFFISVLVFGISLGRSSDFIVECYVTQCQWETVEEIYAKILSVKKGWYKSYIEENPGNLEGTDNGEMGRVVRRRSEWTVRWLIWTPHYWISP